MAVLLIAEDNADVLAVFAMVFHRAGFTVLTAPDGEAALDLARAHRPDVVLTDLDMPRMSGLELCRAIRRDESLRDTPVAIVSGGVQPGELGLDEAALCGVLLKPITNQDLVAAVQRLVQVGRHEHAAALAPCR
jgi:CheY-like chemotaxis protein